MTFPEDPAAPPPEPPPGAPPTRQPLRTHPVLTRGAIVCGVLSLLMIAADLELRGFAFGFLLAIVPVPLYVALALWLDRFEPEPARTLAQTFAWGATVAVFIALVVNGFAADVVMEMAGEEAAEAFASVISAPVVEELAKGFALFFLFRELKDEFDGVVDGVVYAAMVGLGFAMVENVQYYGVAVQEGTESGVVTFFVRGMMSPFAHPLFTAMFGIGLGYARERHGEGASWTAPLAGLTGAIVLHSLWNLSSTSGDWFLLMYVLVMLPVFLGVLALIYVSLRREGRLVREHLGPLVADGVLAPEELERLTVVRGRLYASLQALRRGGVGSWRERRELHRISSELAFHRWRMRRGLSRGDEGDAVREREYLHRLRELLDDRAR